MTLKPRFPAIGIVASLGLGAIGRYGMWGKEIRNVDVLAIFAGGFSCGVFFLLLLRSLRNTRVEPAAAAPPKSKGSS